MENKEELTANIASPIEEVNEAIKDLPEDKKRIIQRSISLFMQGVMPVANPIHEKITQEHISAMLTNAEKESVRFYTGQKINKIVGLIIFLVTVSVFAGLLIIFRNHISDIQELITHLLALCAGAYGGYGYGMSKSGKE